MKPVVANQQAALGSQQSREAECLVLGIAKPRQEVGFSCLAEVYFGTKAPHAPRRGRGREWKMEKEIQNFSWKYIPIKRGKWESREVS